MSDILTGKYKSMSPEAVERLRRSAEGRYKTEKDADRAVRDALHQISGMYMSPGEAKSVRRLAQDELSGETIMRILSCHASTRERLDDIDGFYRDLLDPVQPESILDLACGLNPVYLGWRGYDVTGYDMNGDCVDLINLVAERTGYRMRAYCRDLLSVDDYPKTDLVLLMKLFPVLESQQKGSSIRLLSKLSARRAIVSFPTRTISGRGVGMERHYSDWFESQSLPGYAIAYRRILCGELCYTLERRECRDDA